MEQERLSELYGQMCRKAARNAQKIGSDLREFPGRRDGQYFAPPRDSLRPLSHIFCWTQSFFTGMALLAAEHTGDGALLRWCNSFYEEYRRKVFDTPQDTMHDLGFLYTLYSTLNWKLTGSSQMRDLSLQAAQVLAHRFVPNGGYIQAWGRMDGTVPAYVDETLAKDNFFANSKGLAIIDCLMNLPLLFWAGQETGDPFYTQVAMAHADTTLRCFVRPDGSVCHAWRFDPETGVPVAEFNDCGYGVGSHWARGTAWAVYGFAVAWRYTGLDRYRDAALTIARTYVAACGADPIPVWDFRLPAGEPARYGGKTQDWPYWDIRDPKNRIFNVDSSAAAILCCGILELLEQQEYPDLRAYMEQASDRLLTDYLQTDPEFPGLLRRVNGTDTYGCFGDYFVMELTARLLGKNIQVW